MFPTASILTRAFVVATFGTVIASEPSFAVLAARTIGEVWPPSTESEIFTLAVLTGARFVLAGSHVTVRLEPAAHVVAVFGEDTRNGPAFVASSSVESALLVPPFPSRAV